MHLLVALAAPEGGVCTSRFVSSLDNLCRAEPFALPSFLFQHCVRQAYVGHALLPDFLFVALYILDCVHRRRPLHHHLSWCLSLKFLLLLRHGSCYFSLRIGLGTTTCTTVSQRACPCAEHMKMTWAFFPYCMEMAFSARPSFEAYDSKLRAHHPLPPSPPSAPVRVTAAWRSCRSVPWLFADRLRTETQCTQHSVSLQWVWLQRAPLTLIRCRLQASSILEHIYCDRASVNL